MSYGFERSPLHTDRLDLHRHKILEVCQFYQIITVSSKEETLVDRDTED